MYMNTFRRRLIGVGLIGGTIISSVVLAATGVWSRILEFHTETTGAKTVTSIVTVSQVPLWTRVLYWSVMGTGLLILLWPKRIKTNA